MDDPSDVATIVAGLQSEQEQSRKLAAFSLQGALTDSAFADAFAQGDGIPVLRKVILQEHGNTLAYALGSFCRLLQLDMGWQEVSGDLIASVRHLQHS